MNRTDRQAEQKAMKEGEILHLWAHNELKKQEEKEEKEEEEEEEEEVVDKKADRVYRGWERKWERHHIIFFFNSFWLIFMGN